MRGGLGPILPATRGDIERVDARSESGKWAVGGDAVLDEKEAPVVEDEPAVLEAGRHDRMVLAQSGIAHQYKTKVAGRNAGLAQGRILGDGIILAVPSPAAKVASGEAQASAAPCRAASLR